MSVRRSSSIDEIKSHASITPFASALEFIVVPDITADGAFDEALKDVTYIQHIASPLPNPTDDPERDIIIPAIKGTTSILNSALNIEAIRRVVITSSAVAIIPGDALSNGDPVNVYTANSRVTPLPTTPWGSAPAAYRSAKALALDATDRFLAEKKPKFSIINVMPGYVLGRNDLVNDAASLAKGSNALVIGIVSGVKAQAARPLVITDIRDIARIHVESLDEAKVQGNQSYLLDAAQVPFDDAIDIAKKYFPDAVKDGTLPLGGSLPPAWLKVDGKKTREAFGALKTYEEAVVNLLEQYVELKRQARMQSES